jgi:hypothetical protein
MWKESYRWKEISNEERPQNVRTEECTRKGVRNLECQDSETRHVEDVARMRNESRMTGMSNEKEMSTMKDVEGMSGMRNVKDMSGMRNVEGTAAGQTCYRNNG